jgi:hypothetical protein
LRKDFTDPHTLLIALGITIIVSVVEGGIPNGGYIREILAITIYPMEQALPAAMIVENFSGSGNIVKCEWRRSFSDVDYEFRKEEVAFKHVDYIIYRRKFYQTKAAFFVTERVYRQLLKYYFSAFF